MSYVANENLKIVLSDSDTMPSILSRIKVAKETLSPLCYDRLNRMGLHSTERLEYENAIRKLNSLQTNASVLQQARERGRGSHVQEAANVEATTKYLLRTGISLERLDNLSVIHVSGTKGKGTTCALCESILSEYGYKTGFFSSPHLVAVKERIRINGLPLSNRKFSQYFHEVYDQIESKKEYETDMPAYFKFLTVMALNVFIKEKVDVAVVEVGIGGEYDCTNCIRTPSVVGITSLGYDHTQLLGGTLSEIAWQKAGIIKPTAATFTVTQKTSEALDVLKHRAENRQSNLYVSPPLDAYLWDPSAQMVRNVDNVQSLNMSLALQLANEWMRLQSPYAETKLEEKHIGDDDSEQLPMAKPFEITKKMATGLRNCKWPGRTQVIPRGDVTYFLDGAHTEESVEYCMNWFICSSKLHQNSAAPCTKVLIFNTTGHRDADRFLRLMSAPKVFEYAVFTTNVADANMSLSSDQMSVNTTAEEEIRRCKAHLDIWRTFNEHLFAENSQTMATVSEALLHVEDIALKAGGRVQVLITGSLRLVGTSLGILDPELAEPSGHVLSEAKPLQTIYTDLQAIL